MICFSKMIQLFLQMKKKRPTMRKLLVVGLHELQPLFDTCELFVGRLWNVFLRL